MNNLLFNQLVDRRGKELTEAEVKQLENLATVYPFCQTAHLLLAKVFKDQGSSLSDMKIKTAAAYSVDRKQLKDFLLEKESDIDLSSIENESPTSNNDDLHEVNDTVEQEDVQKNLDDKVETDLEKEKTEVSEEAPEVANEEVIPESPHEKEKSVAEEIRESLEELKRTREQQTGVSITSEDKAEVSEPTDKIDNHSIDKVEDEKTDVKPDLSDSVEDEKEVKKLKILGKKVKSHQKKVEVEVKNYQLGEDVVDSRLGESGGVSPNSEADLILKYLEKVEEKKDKSAKKKENQKVIDAFIKNNPVISRPSKDDKAGKQIDFSKGSSVVKKQIISENMANIQIKQGRYKQAIEIYEQLILKKPEKKSYFVGLIEELKNKL